MPNEEFSSYINCQQVDMSLHIILIRGLAQTPFNNISVISWGPVLLVEKTTDLSQVTDKLYHIML
jgi:hypothetical protein